ncbi:MAG: hypothetical protein KC994_05835 [Candidatus Omnitrophica bacterium]|nr:hypothetical protein [Candidatus Omnitrophota bacterium]
MSFILVIALLLRTIVDQDFINQELGSIVGIAYATLLICLGYSRYSKSHPLAPTYVTCALLIMFSILLETHSRGFIPVWLAYAALGLTLIVSTVLGVRHSASIPLWVGVLGSSLVGIALEFPSPHYPQLMILLLVANASVYIGSKVSIWLGLRWTLFAISLFVWHLWTVQLRTLLLRGREIPEELALNWFLPLLGAFALVYAGMVIRTLMGRRRAFRSFEKYIPLANVLWAYAAAVAVVRPWLGEHSGLAPAALALGVVQIVFGIWISHFGPKGKQGGISFTIAGAVLFVLSSEKAMGSPFIYLPVWSLMALGMTYLSVQLNNRTIRTGGYLLQALTLGVAIRQGCFTIGDSLRLVAVCLAIFVSSISLIQYFWCRWEAEAPNNGMVALMDPKDRSAVVLLVTSLVSLFLGFRLILHAGASALPGDTESLFQSGQTLLIAGSSIFLLLVALRWRDIEFLSIALIVALVAGIKVFGVDTVHARGIPLVLSVLSFAICASVASLVWGRWQRLPQEEGAITQPSLDKGSPV